MRCVVCVRSPADAVASSLRRSTAISRRSWAELWLDYTARALASSDHEHRIVISYEQLLGNRDREVERLAAFLGLPAPNDAMHALIAKTVRDDLRHHRSSPVEVAADAGLPVATRGLYLALEAASALDAAPQLQRGLTRIGVELWRAHFDTNAEIAEAHATIAAAWARERELRAMTRSRLSMIRTIFMMPPAKTSRLRFRSRLRARGHE